MIFNIPVVLLSGPLAYIWHCLYFFKQMWNVWEKLNPTFGPKMGLCTSPSNYWHQPIVVKTIGSPSIGQNYCDKPIFPINCSWLLLRSCKWHHWRAALPHCQESSNLFTTAHLMQLLHCNFPTMYALPLPQCAPMCYDSEKYFWRFHVPSDIYTFAHFQGTPQKYLLHMNHSGTNLGPKVFVEFLDA